MRLTTAEDDSSGERGGRLRERLLRGTTAALIAAFFIAMFVRLTFPVTDPDFWWHLAAGRWMAQHGSLMRSDPFTAPTITSRFAPDHEFALTQYWLAELLSYGIHNVAGLPGVIVLRATVLTLLFFLLWIWVCKEGAPPLFAAGLTALAAFALLEEVATLGDRPQNWSNLAFIALFLILERVREGRTGAHLLLPGLMVLWSNLHGGYLIGVAVILLYCLAVFRPYSIRRRALLAGVVAVLASGLNPNGYSLGPSYLKARLLSAGPLARILEEQSLLSEPGAMALPWQMPALTALVVLSGLAVLLNLRRSFRERPEMLVLYFTMLVLAAQAKRFVFFFLVLALWQVGSAARRRFSDSPAPKSQSATPVVVLAGSALLLMAFLVLTCRISLRQSFLAGKPPVINPYAGAADFIRGRGLSGNIFNDYDAGGYLIWALEPASKVFVDGRILYRRVFQLYLEVNDDPDASAGPARRGEGRSLLRATLDDFDIDLVLLPGCDLRNGAIVLPSLALAEDPDWALAYADRSALVFLRRNSPQEARLKGSLLPKTALYDNMIEVASVVGRSRRGQRTHFWEFSLAWALLGKGDKSAALQALDRYLAAVPNDKATQGFRRFILSGTPAVAP